MATREFDVVLYGATGFVGRHTVAYFGGNAPKGLRWAIAGRDRDKLEALGSGVPIRVADARNKADVDALAAKTRVILTTAGPFKLYGDPLVDACVRLGTHYVDISGEPARIRGLIDRYHREAKAAGVRIVNFCAFKRRHWKSNNRQMRLRKRPGDRPGGKRVTRNGRRTDPECCVWRCARSASAKRRNRDQRDRRRRAILARLSCGI